MDRSALAIADLKRRQIDHANRAFSGLRDPAYEGHRFHDHFRAIPFAKLEALLDACGVDLSGQRVLVAGCGNGIDLHYLKKHYDAEYFVSDIGVKAVEATVGAFAGAKGPVADNENLAFADDAFDYAFTASSLHHLPRPLKGLYELLRVSRRGVIAIEPNDSWLTRLATRTKLATEYEPCGNYVYRFGKRDVERVAKSLYGDSRTARLFAVHRIARHRLEFAVLKVLNRLANLACPAFGNTIVFYIARGEIGR